MPVRKRNLTIVIREDIRDRYLEYCTITGVQKGMLAERLFDSFLQGETFTPADVGALNGSMHEVKKEESRSPSAKVETGHATVKETL